MVTVVEPTRATAVRCGSSTRTRTHTVAATDGVPLTVSEVGPPSAELTVILVHGHCLSRHSWHGQIHGLATEWGDRVRILSYDHRGHGDSGHSPAESLTIDQLAHDLATIIETCCRQGPVTLVGHSLGGMTILAYLRSAPADHLERITGLGLIATAAAGVATAGIGRGLRNPIVDLFGWSVRHAPCAMERLRRATRSLCAPIITTAAFGPNRISPTMETLVAAMLNDTSLTTVAGFLPSIKQHDETAALPRAATLPTLVLCGSDDMMTPFVHSERLAAHLPHATLVRVEGAGHMVPVERPHTVTAAVSALVHQVLEETQHLPREVS